MANVLFFGCTSLTSLNLPNLSTFDSGTDSVFMNSTELTEVTLTDKLTWLPNQTFMNCNNLVSVGDLSNIEGKIGNSAFENCYKLKRVNLSNKVTEIGDDSFWNCYELEDVGDVSNVTTCIDRSFENCKKLTSLNFSNKLTTLPAAAFEYCESITSFGDLSGLTGSLTKTFYGCKSIKEYPTFKNSKVTRLESVVFEQNISLETITLPPTITYIGHDIFYNDTNLHSIYLTSLTPPTVIQTTFRFCDADIYVPQEALETYKNADGWKDWFLNKLKGYTMQ